MDNQQGMLENLLIHFAILQAIGICISIFIYRQIRLIKRQNTIAIFVTALLYILLNINLVSDLLQIDDLCMGGVTFAFEIGNLIFSAIFIAILLFIWLITYCQFRLSLLIRKD